VALDFSLPMLARARAARGWLARLRGRGPLAVCAALERLPLADGGERARLYIGNIVRMQEEIGTGGAGFRFMYATFLQELAGKTGYTALNALATRLVEIGDRWQEFAVAAARMIRRRDALTPPALAEHLRAIARDERLFFQELHRVQSAWAC